MKLQLIETVGSATYLIEQYEFPKNLFAIMKRFPDLCVVGGFLRDVCRRVVPEGDIDLLDPLVDARVFIELCSKFGEPFYESNNAWNFVDGGTGKTIQLLKKYGPVDEAVGEFDINVCQLRMNGQQGMRGYEIWGTPQANAGLVNGEAWFVNHKDRKWQRLVKHANLGFKITTADLIDTIQQNFEEFENSYAGSRKLSWEIFDDLRMQMGVSGGE
jgi:hypothetical protein